MYGVKFCSCARRAAPPFQSFEREFFLAPFSFYRLARLASVGARNGHPGYGVGLRCHSRGSLLVALTIFTRLTPSSVRYAHIAKEDTATPPYGHSLRSSPPWNLSPRRPSPHRSVAAGC